MCFTPAISLSTAIFEFLVATFVLIYYKKSKFKLVSIFIYILGLYQFTEFMLCKSNNPELWAKLGFITYTFLPAVGLMFCLSYIKTHKLSNLKYKYIYLFIIPVAVSIFALLKEDFILSAGCDKYYVIVRSLFSSENYFIPGIIYVWYYFFFIVLMIYLLIQHYNQEKDKVCKLIVTDLIIAIVLSLVPALVLLFIFPSLSYAFPSIYCQFAIIFAFVALIAFHLEKKKLNSNGRGRRR